MVELNITQLILVIILGAVNEIEESKIVNMMGLWSEKKWLILLISETKCGNFTRVMFKILGQCPRIRE